MKRILPIALAGVIALSATGCGNNNESGDKGKEYPTITWHTFGEKGADHNMVMEKVNEQLREKIGAQLDLNLIDFGSYENKMNLSISANEPFDICFTSNWLNKYVPNVLKGAYLPLDELIDEHAPNLKQVLPEMVLDIAKYKGQSYAVPNYQILYNQYGITVQKDLAEKYNFDITTVKTLSDIEPFLQQVKDNETGIYPVRTLSYDAFRETYEEIDPVPVYVKIGDDDLKAVARIDVPEAKQAAAFMADWYEKGYIRKDILTVSDDSVDVEANRYAVHISGIKPGVEAEMFLKTGKEYIAHAFGEPYINALSGMSTMLAISKNSKNPDKAIKLIELLNTDKELYNLLVFGIEGVHYNKISDNQVEVLPDAKYKMASAAWAFGNQFNAYYMEGQQPGIWEETDRVNREAVLSKMRGFMFDIEPVKTEVAQLLAVQQEYKDDTLFARNDWEKAYDEYIQKCKRASIDKVVEEAQRQLDEFKKNK